ncbi:MAG: hypothetical protein JSR80_06575 [Verrucomicrobia bacterium]|nr:hypothetical protein [Verrucomicrobiota bacterium]
MREEEEETLLHRLLPDIAARVIAPINENHPALRNALKQPHLDKLVEEVKVQLKRAAAGRGIKFSPDSHLDAILSELRHQIESILQGSDSKKRKVAEFSRFLKEDISNALKEAFETAIELKSRNVPAVQRIATEASLSINQLLAQAKNEFNVRNPNSPAHHLDPEVCEVLTHRINQLDERYSLPLITEVLCEKLGITFIDQLRNKLQHTTMEATLHFQKKKGKAEISSYTKKLKESNQREIEQARAAIQKLFSRPDVREQVSGDLAALEHLYTDEENLAAKFSPYLSETKPKK